MIELLTTYSGLIASVLLHSLWQVGLIWMVYRIIHRDGKRTSAGLYWPVPAVAVAMALTIWMSGSPVTLDLGIRHITSASGIDWTTLAVVLWSVGVLFQLSRLALDYYHISQWKHRGRHISSGPLFDEVSRLTKAIGLKSLPKLRIVANISIPMVVGFIRPVILFPASLLTQLSPEELESIILHELSHIKRHDYLWNLILSLQEAILFFNPFVHWLVRDIRAAREVSCDLQAADITRHPKAMASALLAIEEMVAKPNLAMALNSQGHLTERVHVLMNVKSKDRRFLSPSLMLWAVIGVLPFFLAFHQTEKMTSMKNRFFDVKADSITVPGFHNAIHSLEFESVNGKISDIRINDEPVELTDPQQIYSLQDQMSETSVATNRAEEYSNGLENKYSSRKQARKEHEEIGSERSFNREEKETSVVQRDKKYNLAIIEGYQYGKSLDTAGLWQEWTAYSGAREEILEKVESSEKSYFLKLRLDPEDDSVGDVIMKYDLSDRDDRSGWDGYSSEYVEKEIEHLLLDHGLIASNYSYSFVLTHAELEVNGQQLSEKMHRLFKARYMDMTRKDPSSKFNYQILKNQIR